MRILHIVEPFASGIYQFLVQLTKGVSDYQHTILYGQRENTPKAFKDDFPENTTFIPWKNAFGQISLRRDLLALKEVIYFLYKNRETFDVVHLHSSKAGFIGRVAAKLTGIQSKVIYTPHGAPFLKLDTSKFERKLYLHLERFAYKLGGKLVACSKSEAEIYNRFGMKASYIYNGIDCSSCLSHSVPKKKEIFTVGTCGRICHQKNPKLFNRIAQAFIGDRKVKFIWIGDGELREELKSHNIEITGWLSNKEVQECISNLDIYLSTSLWEGLPMSVLEAMCYAKPLVLSNCVGNKDLVLNNGFLFSSADEAIKAIKLLLNDTKLYLECSYNSKILIKTRFSAENMIENYIKLYNNIARSVELINTHKLFGKTTTVKGENID